MKTPCGNRSLKIYYVGNNRVSNSARRSIACHNYTIKTQNHRRGNSVIMQSPERYEQSLMVTTYFTYVSLPPPPLEKFEIFSFPIISMEFA